MSDIILFFIRNIDVTLRFGGCFFSCFFQEKFKKIEKPSGSGNIGKMASMTPFFPNK